MTRAELRAAGVDDPALADSYELCRSLHRRHGRTYFLATRLLTPARRPAVHALYGLARYADDIVDTPTDDPRERLDAFTAALRAALDAGHSADPLLAAPVHVATRYGLDPALFEEFLGSMRMDLDRTGYPDRAALDVYMRGSAEVIGLQMQPVLGTVCPREEAEPYAAALGKAFQLTNFLRDVGEDLDRGRVYLPADELAVHGVDRDLLAWCHSHQTTDRRVRDALAEQIAFTRAVYRYAGAGVALLNPVSRPCIQSALVLYAQILDRIEDSGFAVFAGRARVGNARRAWVAAVAALRAARARRTVRAVHDDTSGGDEWIGGST